MSRIVSNKASKVINARYGNGVQAAMGVGEFLEKQISVGHLQRASHICDELEECLRLSARIRSDLFGQADLGDSLKDAPRSSNVESLMHDAFEMVRNLKSDLEMIANGLDPIKSQAGQKAVRHV